MPTPSRPTSRTISRAATPTIGWREITGFGNVAADGYDDIRLELLWEIATKHLQPLRDVIGAELR